MKKILFVIYFTFLSNFLFAQDVTKVVVVDKPIKFVYRVTLESLNKCVNLGSWLTYVGAYYDDNDTASIYVTATESGGTDHYKLKKLDKDHTQISYFKDQCLFCTMALAESKLEKTLQWIKDGDRNCQVAESAPTQNILK
jgi:hypothetical protein